MGAIALTSACGARPQDCLRGRVVCAGLVTSFGGVDRGMERQAWLALQDSQAAGEVDRIDHIETVDYARPRRQLGVLCGRRLRYRGHQRRR